ncbi:hypothetical protein IC607_04405 [Cellulomonas sp. JH27-2]|uniref:hypothetical protein n=1 Tax=Cellulomonas sp. JH27-2 TaxID=2774139 RepID=UPI001786D2E3|nr:hypothetical protein [Cellulomonas sp. JH27-2]MBD8058210.1 hypothetical protein [Cellulomonas sp. JH27-2]
MGYDKAFAAEVLYEQRTAEAIRAAELHRVAQARSDSAGRHVGRRVRRPVVRSWVGGHRPHAHAA